MKGSNIKTNGRDVEQKLDASVGVGGGASKVVQNVAVVAGVGGRRGRRRRRALERRRGGVNTHLTGGPANLRQIESVKARIAKPAPNKHAGKNGMSVKPLSTKPSPKASAKPKSR